MANTQYLKTIVEDELRGVLSQQYGVFFEKRVIKLPQEGTHEFDAVSLDGKIVVSIKTASGKTSGGKNPSGKIKDIEAELYYLMLVDAEVKLLVITNSEFYELITRRLKGRLHPSIDLIYIRLSDETQQQVLNVQLASSLEMRQVLIKGETNIT